MERTDAASKGASGGINAIVQELGRVNHQVQGRSDAELHKTNKRCVDGRNSAAVMSQ